MDGSKLQAKIGLARRDAQEPSHAEVVEHELLDSFKQFSAAEKSRASERQRSITRESKAVKLDGSRKFPQNFKLQAITPFLEDIQFINNKNRKGHDANPPDETPQDQPGREERMHLKNHDEDGSLGDRPFSESNEVDPPVSAIGKHYQRHDLDLDSKQTTHHRRTKVVAIPPPGSRVKTYAEPVSDYSSTEMRKAARDDNRFGMHGADGESSTTGRTYSTRPTTVSDFDPSRKPFNRATLAQDGITEELEPPSKELQAIANVGDGQSTISDDSVVLLTENQRKLIIEKCSEALLKYLPSKCLQPHNQPLVDTAFRQSFNAFLKTYSKEVITDAARRSRRRQASKAICSLRNNILFKVQEALGGFDVPDKNTKVITSIAQQATDSRSKELNWEDNCRAWNLGDAMTWNESTSLILDDFQPPFTEPTPQDQTVSDDLPDAISVSSSELDDEQRSVISQTLDESCIDSHSDDQDVYSYLTEHNAFSELTRNLRRAVEQHFSNQMELIRHRVLLALRRPGMSKGSGDIIPRATFRTAVLEA